VLTFFTTAKNCQKGGKEERRREGKGREGKGGSLSFVLGRKKKRRRLWGEMSEVIRGMEGPGCTYCWYYAYHDYKI
jgi:hypothetical protein